MSERDGWTVILLAELELLARYILKIAPTDPEPEEVAVAKRVLARRMPKSKPREESTMPHYKDGTVAQVGDVVRGKGYNIPHEVIGKVLSVSAAETCNLSIACVGQATRVYRDSGGYPLVQAEVEYGETAAFEKIA